MQRVLLSILATLCVVTALIYFGGNAMFPIKDTALELQRIAESKRQQLDSEIPPWDLNDDANENQAKSTSDANLVPSSPEDVTEARATPAVTSNEQLRDALIRFQEAFERADFETAFTWISAITAFQPRNTSYLLEKADVAFYTGRFKESVATYDQAIAANENLAPDLWQRGLALYYAEDFAAGVKQFKLHQTVNRQDVENAVWHFLCFARIKDIDTARENLIDIKFDQRIPMATIFEVFAGTKSVDDLVQAYGFQEDRPDAPAIRLQQYYAHLYAALYQEVAGDKQAAIASLKMAVKVCPLERGNFMGEVARVHLTARTQASD